MIAAAILAGVVTVIISGAIPAAGLLSDPALYRKLPSSVSWLDRDLIAGLRDGVVRQIDLSHMTGIVSFPSYHAALPVILLWGARPLDRIFLPAAGWAALTLAATPIFGGHYVVDMLAGLLLALAAIATVKLLPAERRDDPGRCLAMLGMLEANRTQSVRTASAATTMSE